MLVKNELKKAEISLKELVTVSLILHCFRHTGETQACPHEFTRIPLLSLHGSVYNLLPLKGKAPFHL